ncbi:hypothetical protein RHMOL_Rhmol11G0263900 [Rhododendron molle]|uniref:Uncharacterized protein n=1 Tax=Rhododendron molle TaxID=49168 RepID=A0ACC0LY77_RHOML|nr:hypothetical protein RHMOL_Rhmol11G0263900 [Rhododendron molle]
MQWMLFNCLRILIRQTILLVPFYLTGAPGAGTLKLSPSSISITKQTVVQIYW